MSIIITNQTQAQLLSCHLLLRMSATTTHESKIGCQTEKCNKEKLLIWDSVNESSIQINTSIPLIFSRFFISCHHLIIKVSSKSSTFKCKSHA